MAAHVPGLGDTVPFDTLVASLLLLLPYTAFSLRETDPKRRAWLLTLVTAAIVGPVGLTYIFGTVIPEFDEHVQFTDMRLSRFLCTFFVVFLVLDTCLGAVHYPAQFHPFEGWFHHAAYTAFFLLILHWGYTVAGATTLALELPTAILACGHCFPSQRQDLLYGVAFFLVRVCLHSFLLAKWIMMADPPAVMWPCTALSLLIHVQWFYKWCTTYARVPKAKGAE